MDDLARECPSRGRAVNKSFRPGEGYSKRVSVRGRGARNSYCPGEELSGIVSSIGRVWAQVQKVTVVQNSARPIGEESFVAYRTMYSSSAASLSSESLVAIWRF